MDFSFSETSGKQIFFQRHDSLDYTAYCPLSAKKKANSLFHGGKVGETLKWGLHPLIHTFATSGLRPRC